MAINVFVQYNGGFLPDILLLTQAPIYVRWHYYRTSYIITTLLTMYYSVSYYVRWLCMTINISVQYNGGLLPDSIMLTQGYHVEA